MQRLYQFQTADKIVSGQHAVKQLGDYLPGVNRDIRSVLVLTQPGIKDLGLLDSIYEQLEDVHVKTITDVMLEPTVGNIEDMHEDIKNDSYDVIIGVGGGSVLDAAKVLSVLKTNDQSVNDMLGTNLIEEPGIPTVLIPTTSGTGSEVTPNAIVTFPEEELKIGIVSPYLLPDLVVLDPMLTLGLPKSITAATGMDAFTHSLESYISSKANYLSDTFAMDSIRLISSSIVEAYRNGENVEAREKMIVGSMYGGMALTSAGTAAVHALAYPLGGKFKVAHGVANAMLLPHVMEFNLDAITEKLSNVAKEIRIADDGEPDQQAAEKMIEQIKEWTKTLEIPQDLSEYGVAEEDIEDLAVAASKITRLLDNNPKELSLEDMKNIYRRLLG
ncbi:iron-containing alcohol dehydrogenase [Salibacterium qingdaonense]|uniref:Alcohol dehydrogenase, class IV n=1 Tax=Salibacterium qingdaonense TaxID=266892 RepID=A0A1I4KK72_9BACI|nr:iron-containing alcohol dehydrogenase [Salibacterium qingdaonense]SFL79172.1 Alcohol dehydrogenase, class IV [Salibacterium qingdaonense]